MDTPPRPDPLPRAAARSRRSRLPGAREIEEKRALGVVEPKGTGDSFEHALRGARGVAALEARVVVDADAGEEGDLLTAKPWDAPWTGAVGAETRLLRG